MIMNKKRPVSASTVKAMEFFNPKIQSDDLESKIHHFTIAELTRLNDAKSYDNKMEPNQNQLKHFLDRFSRTSKHRNLEFDSLFLGPEAGKVLSEMLLKDRHFTKVHLSKNFLGDEGAEAIATLLIEGNTIIHLDISSNNLTHEGAVKIIEALSVNESLVSLDMSSKEGLHRNRLDARGAAPMAWVFQRNQTLQFLNLASTMLDEEGAKAVCTGLQNNTGLLVLNLSSNEIGPSLGDSLNLCLPICEIVELDISNTKLGNHGLATLAPLFWPSAGRSTVLRKLNLTHNHLTAVSISRLFDSLSKNSTLEVLILDKNSLHGKGIASLVNLLWENSTLQHLSMNECELALEACDALSNGLDRNRSLTILHLARNNFKDTGTSALAQAFKSPTSRIQEIDLSDCRIRDEGAAMLADAMKTNHCISTVYLRDNIINDDPALAMISAARENKNLMKVELDRNPVSHKYLVELKRMTQNNFLENKRGRPSRYEKEINGLRDFEQQKFTVAEEKLLLAQKSQEAQIEVQQANLIYKREHEHEVKLSEEVEGRLEALIEESKKLDQERNELDKKIMKLGNDAKDELFDVGAVLSDTMQQCIGLENEIKRLRDSIKGVKLVLVTKRDRLQEELQIETRQAKTLETSVSHINRELVNMQKALEERKVREAEEEKAKKELEKMRERSGSVMKKKGSRGSVVGPERGRASILKLDRKGSQSGTESGESTPLSRSSSRKSVASPMLKSNRGSVVEKSGFAVARKSSSGEIDASPKKENIKVSKKLD